MSFIAAPIISPPSCKHVRSCALLTVLACANGEGEEVIEVRLRQGEGPQAEPPPPFLFLLLFLSSA